MKTILASIDFSPVSRRVVAHAVELARALEARVVLLHSVPPPPIIATDVAALAEPALLLMADGEKAARRHLQRIRRALEWQGIAVDAICTSGFPVTSILAQAEKIAADYIVIGSHGHSALYHLVIGSTANGVLKRARCPIVVVPAAKKGKDGRKRHIARPPGVRGREATPAAGAFGALD